MGKRLEEEPNDVRIQIVAPSSLIRRLDDWRRKQPVLMSRSKAIRTIIERTVMEDAA